MDASELSQVSLRGGGRSGLQETPLRAAPKRALEASDLERLSSQRLTEGGPPAIQKVKHVHHRAAQLMVMGLKDVQISAALGTLTPQRLYQLRQDPSFQELLAHYEGEQRAVEADMREQLVSLGFSSLQEIHERLLENPDDVSTRELLEILKTTTDRTGFGPKQEHQHNHNVQGEVSLIDQVKEAVDAEHRGDVVTREGEEAAGAGATDTGEVEDAEWTQQGEEVGAGELAAAESQEGDGAEEGGAESDGSANGGAEEAEKARPLSIEGLGL